VLLQTGPGRDAIEVRRTMHIPGPEDYYGGDVGTHYSVTRLPSTSSSNRHSGEEARASFSTCTDLSKLKSFCGSQTFPAIVRDGLVDHGTTIEAFPCIEYQKEIGESLQPHQTSAFGTFHRALTPVKS
jgi:hypothetical protein